MLKPPVVVAHPFLPSAVSRVAELYFLNFQAFVKYLLDYIPINYLIIFYRLGACVQTVDCRWLA